MSLPAAIVFDFDGVILDSADLKTVAFERLFAHEEPAAARRILDYHKANGGMSRFEKFRWAYREVLRRPLPEAEEKALGKRFNELVEDAVAAADWIAGAEDFLNAHRGRVPLFVASGTPETELRRIVGRRGLEGYFRGVYGSPPKKKEILLRVAREAACPAGAIVMVGDASNDWIGADGAGTRFIGIVPEGRENPFPEGTTVLPDLRGLEAVL